jgi:hypothetical protein
MSSIIRSRRGVAATAALVVLGLLTLSVVHTSGAGAAAAPDDLAGAVRGVLLQRMASAGGRSFAARIDYPAQPAAFGGLQDVNVARTADGEGGFVLASGAEGRLGVYAHRRDGRIRVAAVAGPAYDAWRRRGAERDLGYPLDHAHGPGASERAVCPPGVDRVQAFAPLHQPGGRTHLLCVGPGQRAAWAS